MRIGFFSFAMCTALALTQTAEAVVINGTVYDLSNTPAVIVDTIDKVEISVFATVPGANGELLREENGLLSKFGDAIATGVSNNGTYSINVPVVGAQTVIIEFRRVTKDRATQRLDGIILDQARMTPYTFDVAVPEEPPSITCPQVYESRAKHRFLRLLRR